MISKTACVAVRSRDIRGNSALSTCFSRVSSPFHPEGAHRDVWRVASIYLNADVVLNVAVEELPVRFEPVATVIRMRQTTRIEGPAATAKRG
jgi:hypothetical protein